MEGAAQQNFSSGDNAAIVEEIRKLRGVEAQGLSAQQQSDLWIKIGLAAIALLMALALYNFQQLQKQTSDNSDEIKDLTAAVAELVLINKSMASELKTRGNWMEGIDLYSEESRMKDQKHSDDIGDLRRDVDRLLAERS